MTAIVTTALLDYSKRPLTLCWFFSSQCSCMTIRKLPFCLLPALLFAACASSDPAAPPNSDGDSIRALETERLRSLVEADMLVADRLHADDFQLVNPSGRTFTKEQYLGGIASGALDYLVFEPVSEIQVRVLGESAVVRYRSAIEINVDNQHFPTEHFWHTDTYEYRDGRWQAVWSQATTIAE